MMRKHQEQVQELERQVQLLQVQCNAACARADEAERIQKDHTDRNQAIKLQASAGGTKQLFGTLTHYQKLTAVGSNASHPINCQ